jgi:hypothetical protein
MGRFADARRDGTYYSGDRGPKGFSARPVTPAEMVAAQTAFGGGARPGAPGAQSAALLYDADGHELSFDAFSSPIDGGPGWPIQPRITDASRPPREFAYPIGWNLIPGPRTEDGSLGFDQLRALSLACWQYRVAVNYRKKQVRGIRWEVTPKDAKTPAAKAKFQKDIDRVQAFFRKPNKIDGLGFNEWVGQIVEEMLVVDAVPMFKYPDKAGNLYALVQIDGATIKILIDQFGHYVGYQQILYGYPATQYPTYDPATRSAVIRDADELSGRLDYITTNPSVTNVYGTSTLEQLTPTINIAIARTARQLSWYTDGTVPDSFIEAPEGYTVAQIKQLQQLYTTLYSGNNALRSGMTVLPPGAKYTPAKPFAFSKEESEEIISIICANEGVSRSIFISQTNRATAEIQRDDASDTGLRPIINTLKDYLDRIIEDGFGLPDLEMNPIEKTAGNEWEQAQSKALYVSSGLRTVDEVRAEDGLDPLPESKPTPLALAPPLAPGQAPPGAPVSSKPKGKPGQPDQDSQDATDNAAKSELSTWERFARNRIAKGKHAAPFVASVLPEDVADLVIRGLKTASTDTQVRAVFTEAREAIEKKKANPLRDARKKAATRHLADQTLELFAHQRAAVERVYREASA